MLKAGAAWLVDIPRIHSVISCSALLAASHHLLYRYSAPRLGLGYLQPCFIVPASHHQRFLFQGTERGLLKVPHHYSFGYTWGQYQIFANRKPLVSRKSLQTLSCV